MTGQKPKFRADLYKILPEKAHAVEIGVAEALFSRDILNWNNVDLLYSVDTWATIGGQRGDGSNEQVWHDNNYDNAVRLLKPFGKRSVILRGLSKDMAARVPDGSIDLLYLDGDHSYDGVISDLESWWPKLKPGGVCAGHDYLVQDYGVNQAVHDFARRNGIFEVLTIEENKAEDAGFLMIKPC